MEQQVVGLNFRSCIYFFDFQITLKVYSNQNRIFLIYSIPRLILKIFLTGIILNILNMNLNNYYILTIICIILKDNGIFIIFIEEDLNKIYNYMYIINKNTINEHLLCIFYFKIYD